MRDTGRKLCGEGDYWQWLLELEHIFSGLFKNNFKEHELDKQISHWEGNKFYCNKGKDKKDLCFLCRSSAETA